MRFRQRLAPRRPLSVWLARAAGALPVAVHLAVIGALSCAGCDRSPTPPPGGAVTTGASPLTPAPGASQPPVGDPVLAAAELARGCERFTAGDLPAARVAFTAATTADPACAAAFAWLGRSLVVSSQGMSFSRAIESLERARALDPGLVEAHLDLALARFGLVEYEAARRHFTAYLAAAGADAAPARRAAAHQHLAILARLDGDHATARAELDHAAALAPGDPDLPYERGLTEEEAGDTAAALTAYATALDLERNHLPSHFRRARLLRSLGRSGEAQQAERIHRALQSLFDDSTGRDLKDPRQRAEAWGEIAALDPLNRKARFEQGRALLELDRAAEAALVLDALVRDHPDYVDAHVFGIDLALRRRDRADAVRRVQALRVALPAATREQLPAEMRPLWDSP